MLGKPCGQGHIAASFSYTTCQSFKSKRANHWEGSKSQFEKVETALFHSNGNNLSNKINNLKTMNKLVKLVNAESELNYVFSLS